MTTLQEALPCPFCGKQHTLQVISGQELMDENQEFWQHSESFGVVCDASMPDGKGGCGAMGGFKPTEDEAIEAWNTRTALAQQREQQPVCAGCGIPAGDVHMSTCKSGKWPSRVSNGDTAAPAPVEQRCTYCDGTGDVHSIDGEWRGTCHCAAAPAPQPAQWESLNLAREVLKLNALWNKSTVQAPEISDQLGICRVLAERVNTDD